MDVDLARCNSKANKVLTGIRKGWESEADPAVAVAKEQVHTALIQIPAGWAKARLEGRIPLLAVSVEAVTPPHKARPQCGIGVAWTWFGRGAGGKKQADCRGRAQIIGCQ